MADKKNDYNDEYELADLDALGPETPEETLAATEIHSDKKNPIANPDIRRNALMVIAAIIFAMLLYKFIWPLFTASKKTATEINPPPVTTIPVPTQPKVIESLPQPITPAATPVAPQIEQKLSALELGQQNVRAEVSSVTNQLGGINTNVNELTNKIAQLNQIISTLAAKVDQQSSEVAGLLAKSRPKPSKHFVRKRTVGRANYYLQAVIPGRAWLISSNGSTLTVREGSQIMGYGVVKLIDPNQGRVITSSGQIIRFSQQDS